MNKQINKQTQTNDYCQSKHFRNEHRCTSFLEFFWMTWVTWNQQCHLADNSRCLLCVDYICSE